MDGARLAESRVSRGSEGSRDVSRAAARGTISSYPGFLTRTRSSRRGQHCVALKCGEKTGAAITFIAGVAVGGGATLAKTADRDRQQSAALDLYLRDIARIPLLTRDEEVELAKRIRAGDRQALSRLVEGNLRFVVNVAKSYSKQGVPLSDLINEGNLGLMRAAERFDESRGFKFISYAVWWIRQSILQALADQSRIVRVPLNRVAHIYHMGKTIKKLEQELQREPTVAEVAGEMGVKEHIVATSGRIATSHVSLDSPGTGNDDGALLETLVDEEQAEVDAELLDQAMAEEVEALLEILNEREAFIVRRYFGIGSGETQTLDAIGKELGLTRERIRQIKAKALARLLATATERELDLFIHD